MDSGWWIVINHPPSTNNQQQKQRPVILNFLLAIGILFGAFWLLAVLFGPRCRKISVSHLVSPHEYGWCGSAQTVGMLTGLLGGDIEDADRAQFALRSLQETPGREPTMCETGLAVGMTISQAKPDETH